MEQGGGRRNELNKPVNQQPQKCPRCDSFHTKFCYYNNYSLSQPRYFCKTCRRYWTQGGTLRNVPVGGGCRKEKRAKTLSSALASSNNFIGNYSMSQPLQSQSNIQSTMAVGGLTSYSSAVPYYQSSRGVGFGGGYMSSFAAFNNPNLTSNNFDQSLNVGSSSNLSLLQGFNVTHAASFGNSSQGQNRPTSQQLYQMFASQEQQGLNLTNPSSTVTSTSASAGSDDWPQSFINNGTNFNRATVTDPSSLWSTICTPSINGGVNGSALFPTQLSDLSGFNPH